MGHLQFDEHNCQRTIRRGFVKANNWLVWLETLGEQTQCKLGGPQ